MSLKKFLKLDVPYINKQEGDIIDSSEWNENFLEVEEVEEANKTAFNELVDALEENASNILKVNSLSGATQVYLSTLIEDINELLIYLREYVDVLCEAGFTTITHSITNNQFAIPTSQAVFNSLHVHNNKEIIDSITGVSPSTVSSAPNTDVPSVTALVNALQALKTTVDSQMLELQLESGSADMIKLVYDTNNDGVVNSADEATTLSGLTTSIEELNKLTGLLATVTELNKLSGLTVSTDELNRLSGITGNLTTILASKLESSDVSNLGKKTTYAEITIPYANWELGENVYTTVIPVDYFSSSDIVLYTPVSGDLEIMDKGITLEYNGTNAINCTATSVPSETVKFGFVIIDSELEDAKFISISGGVGQLLNLIINSEF